LKPLTKRIPHIIPPNEYNRFYLETKAHKSGHLIDFHGKEYPEEQSDHPVIQGMDESKAIPIQAQQ
jgi:GTP cyclohydrolase II